MPYSKHRLAPVQAALLSFLSFTLSCFFPYTGTNIHAAAGRPQEPTAPERPDRLGDSLLPHRASPRAPQAAPRTAAAPGGRAGRPSTSQAAAKAAWGLNGQPEPRERRLRPPARPQREAGQGPAPRQPALHPARTTATAPRGSGPGHATDTPPRRYLSCRSYLCSFRLARPGCAIAARSPAAGAAQARASTCAGAPDGCGEGGAAGGAGPSPQGWEPPAELRRRGLSPCLARVIPAGELRRLLGVCRGSAPRRASCGCLLLPAGPGPADPGSWARGFRAGIGGYLRLGCEAAGFVPWLLL